MNFVRQATAASMQDIKDKKKNFEIENKVRTIVADMLLNMNDSLTQTKREVKQCQHELQVFQIKMNETHNKMDREAKIKDLVDQLKQQINQLEKGMALDIENAVKNHEAVTFQVGTITTMMKDMQQERVKFMTAQDKVRGQIKDFENFLNETRGVHDRQMIEVKKEVTKRLDASLSELKELSIDRRQLKSMVKNQNYQFTELQKGIGVLQSRVTVVEKTCAEVPGLLEYCEVTDTYLQNYMPVEIYGEIHRALSAALESAPTKQRLDQIEYSHRRMMEALDKIKQIGTLTQETFVKNEFNPLKLDFDSYSIRTQYEDEERDRMEKEQREAHAAMTRKTSGQIFKDKMFNKENLNKLASAMETRLEKGMKKLINRQLDNNSWMNKLIQFYQEEMGSDDDSDESESESSSEASDLSEGGSKSGSSVHSLGGSSNRSASEQRQTSSLLDADGNKVGGKSHTNSIESKSRRQTDSSKQGATSLENPPNNDSISSKQNLKEQSSDRPSTIVSQHKNSKMESLASSSRSRSKKNTANNNKKKSSKKQPNILIDENHLNVKDEDNGIVIEDSQEESQRNKKSNRKKIGSKRRRKDESIGDGDTSSLLLDQSCLSKGGSTKRGGRRKKLQSQMEQTIKKINAQQEEQKKELESLKQSQEEKTQEILEKVSKAKKRRGGKRDSTTDGAEEEEQDEGVQSQDQQEQQDLPQESLAAKLKDGLKQLAMNKAVEQKRVSKAPDAGKDQKPRKTARKSNKRETIGSGAGGAGPRTGAKANKEALEEIKRKLDHCIMREEFEKSQSNVHRAISTVTVFKSQMKIFEQKFLNDRNYDERLASTGNIIGAAQKLFTGDDKPSSKQGGEKESQKVASSSDHSRASFSLQQAANMKKQLNSNINRIDLLTDSKIGEVKSLMKDLAEQIIKLNKRVTIAENEVLKREYENIPVDVMALSKSEVQLRQDLALMIVQARETKDWLTKEFKRLRREHFGNLKDIEQIMLSFDQLSEKVRVVTDKQNLNDNAMASIFKVMKLDFALDSQDEKDRQSLNLLGLTNTYQSQAVDKTLQDLQMPNIELTTQLADKALSPMNTSDIQSDIGSKTGCLNSAYTTGNFIKKLRASTQIPIEHKMEDSVTEPNQTRPVQVISIDNNCATHASGSHNEIVMKAFKMACLQYKPSPVYFEQSVYKRSELIAAKNNLLKYCLSQLKHLDLGVLQQPQQMSHQIPNLQLNLEQAWSRIKVNQEMEGVNYGEMNPIFMPVRDLANSSSPASRNNFDFLTGDSIDSLHQASAGYAMIAPNSARRMEPVRLSVPKALVDAGAVTQRGRCGKLGDSQQFKHINGLNSETTTNLNLLGAKQKLRQAISVHKVERSGFAMNDSGFNPNRTDSFAASDNLGMDKVVGKACVQRITRNDMGGGGVDNERHGAFFTQGSPLGQLPSQSYVNGQRLNIRTQGGDNKPLNHNHLGSVHQKASEPSYQHHFANNNNEQSTVFSSMHGGRQGGGQYNSFHGSKYTQVHQNHQHHSSNIRRTNYSFDSQVAGEPHSVTNTSGAISITPRGIMTSNQKQTSQLPQSSNNNNNISTTTTTRIKLPCLQYENNQQHQQSSDKKSSQAAADQS